MAVEHLCTICSFTSSTLAGVESHMLKHTAEKRWKCDLCQKGHNTKLAMHTHRMTHTGERPNKCPTCGKGFIQSYHMIDHMRKDHNMVIEHKKKDKKPKEEKRAEQVAPPPVDLQAAVATWRASLSPSMWPQGLPLSQAFLSPHYLDATTRLRLATEMKKALLPLREQGDREGGYYLYTLHDPTLTKVSFHDLAAQLDRHTKFQVFLASLFYIGFGKDDRDLTHFSRTQATRNPKKMDRIEDIQEKGREVYIHRFSRGVNRDQGRYLEALALRATRLGGHLTNLKEERPRGGDPGAPAALHQLMGTQVLWEASRTFGQQGEDIVRSGAFLQCGLCVQAGSLTVYRTTDRAGLSMHQKLRHTEYDMAAPCRKFALPNREDWARLDPRLGVDMAQLSIENGKWLESKNLSSVEPALELINPEDAEGCSKFARKGRGYSTAEEHRLVEHLLVRDRLEKRDWSIGGNAVWRVMEELGVLPGRSWQSMKERFRRVILRKVARGVYSYPFTKEQLSLLDQLRDYQTIRDMVTGAGTAGLKEDEEEEHTWSKELLYPKLPDADRPYQCKLCPMAYTNKGTLSRHTKKHTDTTGALSLAPGPRLATQLPPDSVFLGLRAPTPAIEAALVGAGGSWVGCVAMLQSGGHVSVQAVSPSLLVLWVTSQDRSRSYTVTVARGDARRQVPQEAANTLSFFPCTCTCQFYKSKGGAAKGATCKHIALVLLSL